MRIYDICVTYIFCRWDRIFNRFLLQHKYNIWFVIYTLDLDEEPHSSSNGAFSPPTTSNYSVDPKEWIRQNELPPPFPSAKPFKLLLRLPDNSKEYINFWGTTKLRVNSLMNYFKCWFTFYLRQYSPLYPVSDSIPASTLWSLTFPSAYSLSRS